jgi:malate:Na+ symporter
VQDSEGTQFAGQTEIKGFWPNRWWSVVDYKIGIVPLPVFVILLE